MQASFQRQHYADVGEHIMDAFGVFTLAGKE
jgi:hypothetical protein